jgi:hypothetical protein
VTLGFDMLALTPGDVWDLRSGKRIEVLQAAFLWAGVRWVVVDDHDFDGYQPRVIPVNWFEGAHRVAFDEDRP